MRRESRAISGCWIVVSMALLAAPVAHADLYTAVAAYEAKDHARAFDQFRELAELGHPLAQETLAIMYVLGEGVKRDNVAGFAWAQIAQENGSGAKVQPIIDQLEKSLSADGRARIADLKGRFGRQALEKHLLPEILKANAPAASDPAAPDHPVCRITRPAKPADYYPQEAAAKGAAGSVLMELAVLADGSPRNPRVVMALPSNGFERAGRRIAFDTVYVTPVIDGVRVPCSVSYWVRFALLGAEKERLLATELERLKKGVAAGDPTAQLEYALLSTGVLDLNVEGKNMAPLFIKAAQAGLPTAQFSVGLITLKGWGVNRDRAKGVRWLAIAANAGQLDAQVTLATELLRSKPDANDAARIRDLLEKSAAGGNTNARFFLADQLLGGAGSAPAGPRRSLELLDAVKAHVDDDPTAFEIRAAALSQTGDFEGAIAAQKRALFRARKMRWDLAPLEDRLALYQKNQSWTQPLLVY